MFDFDFLDPMKMMAGQGASFPFGAPAMDKPMGDVTAGTAPPTASWGAPPVPGTPSAAGDTSMMMAGPGVPKPPPPVLATGAPAPVSAGAVSRGEGPPAPTPRQAAASRITPGTPGTPPGGVGAVGPDGKPITQPASDPALRAPYAQPGTPVPGAAPGAPPATAPGTAPAGAAPAGQSFADKMKGLGQNKDFMGALGKMAGGGGGGGGGSVDLSMSGIGGDPAQGSRQGASDLFKSILEGGRPGAVAPVPEFDPRKFLFTGV